MKSTDFASLSRYEKALVKKDYRGIVTSRMALLGYYDDSGVSSSGSGDALSQIFETIGAGAQAAGSVYAASQYGSTTPAPTLINTNAVSAHAPSTVLGSSSLIWIIVLIVIGFFAYREL